MHKEKTMNKQNRLKKLERNTPEEPIFTNQTLLKIQADIRSGKIKTTDKPFDLKEIHRILKNGSK